jgi:GT2 family glycosyltransferase
VAGVIIKKDILVVIPTLGIRKEMLKLCLKSISSQKYSFDVVLIFPKDKTLEIERITFGLANVILEPQNLNMIESVNYILRKYSDYNYFSWISDDDLLTNNCIDRSVSFLESNKDFCGVYGAVDYINIHGRKIGHWNPPKFSQFLNTFIPSAIKLEGSVFKLNLVKDIGMIPPTIKYCPDVFMILKLSKLGKFKKISGPSVAKFRIHQNSPTTSHRYRSNLEAHFLQLKLGDYKSRMFVVIFGPLIYILKILVIKLISRE